ncbi:MAG: tetratricopeptide repeat protein [Candidatus Latescibacterota bacterium]|nr:MAG: tetratricopeptide repeat protein [Candidatus Latescibacterota bacterium]
MSESRKHLLSGFLAWSLVVLVTAAILSAGLGCAYFNTFYNAKRLYKEAEEMPRGKDGEVPRVTKDKYEESIRKCEMLITNYPKSKYVDDAILLIGKCFYEIGQYDEAIIKFNELRENFPDSKLNKEGRLYLAKSYIGKQSDEIAAAILMEMAEDKKVGRLSDEILFLLGTTLIKVEREEEAIAYLEALARRYPRSPRRLNADLEVATFYAERGEYDKSIRIYEGLRDLRLPQADKIKYLKSYARVLVDKGDYDRALNIIGEFNSIVLDPTETAEVRLLEGRALAGKESYEPAMDVFNTVVTSFPRSMYSAEAYFRLGEIYQDKLDSLQVAQSQYDRVGQQYANSPYAGEALKRSISISKYMRLQESIAAGGAEGSAAVQFDLAEIQLFQFNNYEKALEGYRKVLDDFPDSDLAPKAAYAIAYIYDDRLEDREQARQAYEFLMNRYPGSQQAEQARDKLARLDDRVQR